MGLPPFGSLCIIRTMGKANVKTPSATSRRRNVGKPQSALGKTTVGGANSAATTPVRKLSSDEARQLQRLEKIIKSGWATFLGVGEALAEVRDRKLYRENHATFNLYCRDELGYSRGYAYKLIDSAEVRSQFSRVKDIAVKPVTEAQCRELVRLEPAKRLEVWKRAVEKAGDHPVTARIVHQVLNSDSGTVVKTPGRRPAASAKFMDTEAILALLDEIDSLASNSQPAPLLERTAKLRRLFQRMSAPAAADGAITEIVD